MTYEHLLIEIQEQIGWIKINRPKKLNALNQAVLQELHHVFVALEKDNSVRIIVLTGAGEKAFVAGADIAEFADFNEEQGATLAQKGQENVFDFIAHFSKPVIAAVNGFALGGGLELALACHVRIASTNARMGLPETSLGVIPGYGGTQRLPQIIGRGRATEMILTARMLGAEEALQVGLVNKVVELDQLLSTAASMAQLMMNNSSHAMHRALQSIEAGYATENGYREEINHFGACFGHAEFEEGTQAFLNKRKARF